MLNGEVIFDIIQSISVIIASVAAVYGITSWRREAKWKRKYELAEEVLSLFYECRETLHILRSPASGGDEGKSRKRWENESDEEASLKDYAFVFIERYEKAKEPFIKLYAMKYRFIAVFGKHTSEPFDDMKNIIHMIIVASYRLGNKYWQEQGRKNFSKQDFEKHLEEMHKHENMIWASFDDDDEVDKSVRKCITKIEDICSIIMKNK